MMLNLVVTDNDTIHDIINKYNFTKKFFIFKVMVYYKLIFINKEVYL